jgi:hypothetical protein
MAVDCQDIGDAYAPRWQAKPLSRHFGSRLTG